MQPGSELVVFDGQGQEADARIAAIGKTTVEVEILATRHVDRESVVRITVMQSLCAGEKMDWVIQKTCELGAQRIIPIAAARSVLRLSGDRAQKRVSHWSRISQATSAQCGRNQVAQITEIKDLREALSLWASEPAPKTGWLLDPFSTQTAGKADIAGDVTLMIGPEAGWTDEEEKLAQSVGFVGIRCGSRILRTETAACVVMASILTRCGEF